MDLDDLPKDAKGNYLDENGHSLTDPKEVESYLRRVSERSKKPDPSPQNNEENDRVSPLAFLAMMGGGTALSASAAQTSATSATQQERLLRKKQKNKLKAQKKAEKEAKKAYKKAQKKADKAAKNGKKEKHASLDEPKPDKDKIQKPEEDGKNRDKPQTKPDAHETRPDKASKLQGTGAKKGSGWRIGKGATAFNFAGEVIEDAALPTIGCYAAHRITGKNRIDSMKMSLAENKDQLIASTKDAAIDVGVGLVPFGTSYQMGKAAWTDIKAGNWKGGLMNGGAALGWGAVDGVGLALSFGSAGLAAAPVQGGIAAAKLAKNGTKLSKLAKVGGNFANTIGRIQLAEAGYTLASDGAEILGTEAGQMAAGVVAAEVTGNDEKLKDLGKDAINIAKDKGLDIPAGKHLVDEHGLLPSRSHGTHAPNQYAELKSDLGALNPADIRPKLSHNTTKPSLGLGSN